MVAAATLPGERRSNIPVPIKVLAVATAFGLTLLAGLGLYIWSAARAVSSVRTKEFRALEVLAIARDAIENRKTEARIGVATTDSRWRSRYPNPKAGWDIALAELRRLAPNELETDVGRRMVESSDRLVAIELAAFRFAQLGQEDRAEALLFGKEYDRVEVEQRDNAQQFGTLLRRRLQWMLEREDRRGGLARTSFCVAFPLLLATWMVSLRVMLRRLEERHRADERLQESEQRLQTLFEGIDDALLVHDVEGRILDCNTAACRRLGYTRVELLALRTADIDSPEFARGFAQRCAWQMENQVYVYEGEHLNKDGRRIPVEINTHVIVYRGAQAVLALVRDITERKRAEAELDQMREAADSANTAKSEFLANMSHEIRTPMNGILGMTELILGGELATEQRQYLEMVKVSADSLLTVINDILDFSKIEAGKLLIEPIEFHLRDTLADLMKALAFRAQEKGVDLAYRVPAGVPDKLRGDPGRLKQVIVNLAGNAIKFTAQGEVLVSASVDSREGDSVMLHVTVADTGIGIRKEVLRTIFDPFKQADGSTTRKYGGTGLGLTIAAQLAGLMGGRVWAESEPGKGSVFHFTARLGVLETLDSETPASRSPLEGLSVLVIDENATSRDILQEILLGWRMKPVTAGSAGAAIGIAQEAASKGDPLAMVILDAKTSIGGAPGTTGHLGSQTLPGSPPVILLTPPAGGAEAEKYRESGIRAWLRKPVRQSELFDAMMTVIAAESLERFDAFRTQGPAPQEKEPAPVRALRILVAEDNPVNQRLLVGMLEKRGHSVALVSNGRQAVETLVRQSFDLALLDIQMPEMSGLEAAAAVRARERESGVRHRLPIMAITANAMKGDREECLAAGMDAYLAKPIHQEELFAMIQNVVIIPESNPVISFDCSLFDGDPEFLAEIVNLFLATYPDLLSEIDEALLREDADGLRRAAHTMKGAVANFGAKTIVEQARILESLGKSGDLAAAHSGARQLRALMDAFAPQLEAAVAGVGEKQVST
jgi:two-component system sensor histidine kinase/response regulator